MFAIDVGPFSIKLDTPAVLEIKPPVPIDSEFKVIELAWRSRMPSKFTADELLIEPTPLKIRVAPAPIVVAPV